MIPDIRPGDCIGIAYHHGNLIQEGICAFENGKYAHIICALGKYETVEANTSGVNWTDLRSYILRHDCTITVRRLPGLSKVDGIKITDYWESHVGEPYSYSGDIGLGITLILQQLGLHRIVGRALRIFPNLLAPKAEAFCSQEFVRGVQQVGRLMYSAPATFSPERLMKTSKMFTVHRYNGKCWR